MMWIACALTAWTLPAPQEPPAAVPPAEPFKKIERIQIPRDDYPIFGELWRASPDPNTPMLVLYHQARSSHGEYRPIAPRLRDLGYNLLLIDLSVGATFKATKYSPKDVKNPTARYASQRGTPTYLDCQRDIEDSLLWARTHHAHQLLVAWGSSYSASLALNTLATRPDLIDGALAFSPGEYFGSLGKSRTWVRDTAAGIESPVFVTGSRSEEAEWRAIFEVIPAAEKQGFVSQGAGRHGSRVLLPDCDDAAEYWQAVEAFLKRYFPATPLATPGPTEIEDPDEPGDD